MVADHSLAQPEMIWEKPAAIGLTPVANMGAAFQAKVAPAINPPNGQITFNPGLIEQIRGAGMLPDLAPGVKADQGLFGAVCDLTEETVFAVGRQILPQQAAPAVAPPLAPEPVLTRTYTRDYSMASGPSGPSGM